MHSTIDISPLQLKLEQLSPLASSGFRTADLQYNLSCLSHTLLNKTLIQLQLLQQLNRLYMLAGPWFSILRNWKFLGNEAKGNLSPSLLETRNCTSQSKENFSPQAIESQNIFQ